MNTNIVLTIDTRRTKKDGTFPIIMRLSHQGYTLSIPINESIKKQDWDITKRQVKGSYIGIETPTRFNNRIQQKRIDALRVIQKLEDKKLIHGLAINEIKSLIQNESSSDSFIHFAETQIEQLRQAKRFGTADAYKDALNAIITFSGKRDLKFEAISFKFLTNWETKHLQAENSINGLAAYLRSIRAIFNKAILAGIVDKELYPFTSYKIKTKPTQKRALDTKLLDKIIKKKFKPSDPHFDARNYFLLSYMMYGMNFIDMAYFKKEDIADGRIYYRRSKTSRLFDIKITPGLEKLLAHYINLNPKSKFVFPFLEGDDVEYNHKQVKLKRRIFNTRLEEMAEQIGIDKKVTSYVIRHSFATQAVLLDIPLTAVSAMLGHSSFKTTQIYIDSLPTNILDKYNATLVNRIK
jgi:integrase/recombinase XerD